MREKDGSNEYFAFTDGTFDDPTIPDYDEFNFAGRPEQAGTAYTIADSWDDTIITASANWAFADNHRAYVTTPRASAAAVSPFAPRATRRRLPTSRRMAGR